MDAVSIAKSVTEVPKFPFFLKKRKMVLDTCKTKLLPRDYHALKRGKKKKKKKSRGRRTTNLCLCSCL